MPIKPLRWFGSIALFGIPSLVITCFLFVIMPGALARGASQLQAVSLGFMLPLALMLVAAFVAYRLEGRAWSWAEIRERFRLQRPDRRTWLWTAGLVVWLILWMEILPFNGLLKSAFEWLHFYDAPAGYTAVMNGLTDGKTQIFGLPFTWGLLLYYLFGLFVFNILGEELWWRGYILPRQELVFGARTWIIHGTLWALFHFFYHTNLGILVSYLPTTLGIAFVAQRTRNTWPGIIGHMVSNMMVPLLMLSRLLA
jgi:membrane protease YdiL (CAAX protease family)